MFLKRRNRYENLLKRRRRKINHINRQELVDSIQSSGRINNLLATLERMEKLVEWQSQIKGFIFLLIKRQHEDLVIDIINTIKKDFFVEINKNETDLSEEGFFLFNMVCFSGTAIDQATRYYTIIKYVFLVLTISIYWFLFFNQTIESIYLSFSLLLLLFLYVGMYWFLCLRIRIELIGSFKRLKDTMLESSKKIASSILEGIESALSYREEQQELSQDIEIADSMLILVSTIGQYDAQTKVFSVLESDSSQESLSEVEKLKSAFSLFSGNHNDLNMINRRKSNRAMTDFGNRTKCEDVITSYDSTIKKIDRKITSIPSGMREYFYLKGIRKVIKELSSSFEIDNMSASSKFNALEILKDILGELKMGDQFTIGNISINGDNTVLTVKGDVKSVIRQNLQSIPVLDSEDTPNIRELLTDLEEAIEKDSDITDKGKEKLNQQLALLTELAKDPKRKDKSEIVKKAIEFLENALEFLPKTSLLFDVCGRILPLIGSFFGIPAS